MMGSSEWCRVNLLETSYTSLEILSASFSSDAAAKSSCRSQLASPRYTVTRTHLSSVSHSSCLPPRGFSVNIISGNPFIIHAQETQKLGELNTLTYGGFFFFLVIWKGFKNPYQLPIIQKTKHNNIIYMFVYIGFSGGSAVKNLPANAGNTGQIPGLGRFPVESNG